MALPVFLKPILLAGALCGLAGAAPAATLALSMTFAPTEVIALGFDDLNGDGLLGIEEISSVGLGTFPLYPVVAVLKVPEITGFTLAGAVPGYEDLAFADWVFLTDFGAEQWASVGDFTYAFVDDPGPAPVPLPAAAPLLAAAIGVLGAVARRRRGRGAAPTRCGI